MVDPLKLMCILAHPDDESLGMGGVLAKYAAEGVQTHLITATRGQRGWQDKTRDNPGPEALGQLREAEVRAAAKALGVREIMILDYMDGDLDQANPAEAVATLVGHLRRVRPQIVVSFGPDGAYGHPDHIAICQFASAAVIRAADPSYADGGAPYSVAKLYYRVVTQTEANLYQYIFGDIEMPVDGVVRRPNVWPDWSVTTHVQAGDYAPVVQRAIACHQTQLPGFAAIQERMDARQRDLCDSQTYYRAYSLVNGGRAVEDDLFAGLR